MADPAISFIIPAHNEQRLLASTLDALFASAKAVGRPFEVIVVNDASTDHTGQIALEHGARVVPVELRHIAAVRNAGAQQAVGETLIFVDADTLVPQATLRAALQAIDEGAVGGGAAVAFDQRLPIWMRLCITLFMLVYRLGGWATGCFVFVRRDAFEAVGGFDEQYFAAEEWFLSRALKRHGRFVVVGEPVITSARKAQQYSSWRLIWTLLGLLLKGPRAMRQREGLEIWYGPQHRGTHRRAPAEPTSP